MRFLRLLSLAVIFAMGSSSMAAESPPAKTGSLWVFIGTYTNQTTKGIYRAELDLATGKLSNLELAAESKNPSFLSIHPSGKFLYAVGEIKDPNGKPVGGVRAFTLEPKTGKLTFLNERSSVGAGPCHVASDREGKCVIVANYGGGSSAVFPILPDGSLGEVSTFVQHKAENETKDKPIPARAHSTNVDRSNQYAMIATLGLNKVMIFKLDSAHAKIVPNEVPFVELEPGAGPRHFAFHPTQNSAYVINELGSTLTALAFDPKTGALKKLNTLSTLPSPHKGNSTAEVVVHPNGKFVYGSNRGHNSIAIFAIDPKSGEIKSLGHQTEGIKIPRNFNIDPTGQYMLVGNQDGASVIVFKIDPETGLLKPTDVKVEVGSPVCVKFLAKP